MRIDVAPTRTAVTPGQPIVVTASVFNTGDVIAAYRVDVLGVDARWVQTDVDSLQLFPGSSGTVVVTITLPPGIPAGTRTLGLQVTELTPPGQVELGEVELVVVHLHGPFGGKRMLSVDDLWSDGFFLRTPFARWQVEDSPQLSHGRHAAEDPYRALSYWRFEEPATLFAAA